MCCVRLVCFVSVVRFCVCVLLCVLVRFRACSEFLCVLVSSMCFNVSGVV